MSTQFNDVYMRHQAAAHFWPGFQYVAHTFVYCDFSGIFKHPSSFIVWITQLKHEHWIGNSKHSLSTAWVIIMVIWLR